MTATTQDETNDARFPISRGTAAVVVARGIGSGARVVGASIRRTRSSVTGGLGLLRRRRSAQAGLLVLGATTAAWISGLMLARKLTRGDEGSDDFQLATIMGGREFHSHARQLRSGTVITSLGGIELDLREATLDPSGADLELRTTMGGIEVRVPQYWVVEVDQDALGGQLEVDVAAAADLPDDAPRLHIHAVTRMGGGLVTARTD